MTKRYLDFNKPRLFASTKRPGAGAVLNKNAQELLDTNVASTASFRYDPLGLGIRSTQQIPVDFSKFENHTFFCSARANVNVAFDRIINEFPFDGSRKDVEAFLDSLTGFEKWIFDSFPKNKGYLHFSSSYISVADYAGYLYPSISKRKTGDNVLDPELKPFTIELQLFLPQETNQNQVICQKISGSSQGITLAVSQSSSTSTANVVFVASSGSLVLSASALIEKGQFNHLVATFDRHPGINQLQLFVNEALVSTSSNYAEMGLIGFKTSPFNIATGSTHDRGVSSTLAFVPSQTLSGAIDELRVFHGVRSLRQQQLSARKSIYASDELKLYFKFNEPTGSLGPDDVVLDSSGNSLHAIITNYVHTLRSTGSVECPMTYEKLETSPILYPGYVGMQSLNEDLLLSASRYDDNNPNLITKLVPQHYFQEGKVFDGLSTQFGTIIDEIDSNGLPGTVELGSTQLLMSMLYVWAKMFDEIKMSLDLFGKVLHVDYDKDGFTADQFLPFLAKYFGFEMPAFFVDASIEQFVSAENVADEISNNALSLQYVQNQIWRRILTNIGDIIRSKGTLHSIKSLFRSMGIDPDSSFRIREFGGPTFRSLENARDKRSAITTMLDFSGSLAPVSDIETIDTRGFHASMPRIVSTFLSSSRIEPGYPLPRGTFVASPSSYVSMSNNSSDGLLTSGSWTLEGLYRFPVLLTGSHPTTQSLMRLHVTGTTGGLSGSGGIVANLLAVSGSNVTLFISPGFGAASGTLYPTLTLPLTGADVMDGHLWYISFGRNRGDEIGAFHSSSYFIRAARQEYGDIVEKYTTSSFFIESGSTSGATNAFEQVTSTQNTSGTFIVIGSQSVDYAIAHLNEPSNDAMSRFTVFSGYIAQLRFWSKALTDLEWPEHVKNFRSVGVTDPLTNFNFNSSVSGSFERLRVDLSMEQVVTLSNASGEISIFDFSQNDLHVSGSGFQPNVNLFKPTRVFYSQLSPRFDENVSDNKVRIRGFKDYANVEKLGGEIAPVHEVPRNELSSDDARFSIDFSITDALDDDISRIFATFDELDNALGNPELIFSPDYPDLENMRDIYFNRLTSSIKLKQFFEFFKWFDTVLGVSTLIEQLVPRKTKFLGTNFVIESHMLERSKVEYLSNDIYMGEDYRNDKGTVLLQQFVGVLRKF